MSSLLSTNHILSDEHFVFENRINFEEYHIVCIDIRRNESEKTLTKLVFSTEFRPNFLVYLSTEKENRRRNVAIENMNRGEISIAFCLLVLIDDLCTFSLGCVEDLFFLPFTLKAL